MRTFNLVKSLSTLVNNITSLPFREGLGLGSLRLLILCLSLATFGVEGVWGNSVSSKNSGDDVSGKQIIMSGNHAKFYLTSPDNVSWNKTFGCYNIGTISKNGSKTYTFTWEANTGCNISVTNISFKMQAYNSLTRTDKNKAKAKFNNGEEKTIGNISLGTTLISFGGDGTYTSGCSIVVRDPNNTCSWDIKIKSISITYTITPDAPTIAKSTETITVSLNDENKLDMSTLISVADANDFFPVGFKSSGFTQTQGVGASEGYFTGKYFYAKQAGIYTYTTPYITAKENCHAASGDGSGSVTITVNRLQPEVEMNNGEVTVYTDAAPQTLDLNTLKKATNKTNGDYTYELLGTDAEKRGASISGSTFQSTVGGTFKVRATTSQTGQYKSTTCDFQVTVNRLTPTVTWTPDEDTFVAEEQVAVTSAPGIELNLSVEGDGAEYVTIDNENKIFIIEDYSGATPITATLKVTSNQTDVYKAISGLSKAITISNLTKQHIIWDQDQALTKLKITDNPRSIVLTATSDNGDPVSRYVLEGETTGFSLSQNGDTWTLNYPKTASKGALVRAELDGVEDQYLPASPISLPIKVIDPTSACDISENLATVSGLKNDKKEYALAIPKSVYLHVRRTNREWYALYTNGIEIEFQNAQGSRVGSVVTKSQNDIDDDCDITIDNLDRSITKMIFKSNAGYGYDITVASYTHHSEIGKNKDNLVFETYVGTPVDNEQVFINYANHQIEVSIEDGKIDGVANASSHFSIISGSSFGDCGISGSNTVTIGYTDPGYPCTETATLCVRDNTRALLTSLPLSATVLGGLDQHINFINLPQTFSTTDKVTLQATSDREFEHQFTYSIVSGYTDVAKVEGDKLTFLKDGDFKLRVYEPGTKLYTEAEAFTDVLHVSKVTPAISTNPTASTITYGQKLSESSLTGGQATLNEFRGATGTHNVEGSFAWTEPNAVHTANSGVAKAYQVTWTPTGTDAALYNSATCDVSVLINRANQTITWETETNISLYTPSTEVLNATTTGDGSIVYTIDPSSGDGVGTITDNVLTLHKSGKLVINANAATTANYNAATQVQKTFEVGKRGLTIAWEDKEEGLSDVITTYAAGSGDIGNHFVARDAQTKVVVDIPVTITNSDNTSVINIQNNKLYVDCAGQATITATTAATDQYGAGSGTVTLTSLINTPDFEWQVPQPAPNTAYTNFFTSSNKDSDCNLTFTSNNPTLAKVEGGKLVVGGDAQTDTDVTFTVTQTGNCRWEEHTETFTIHVKKPANHVPFTITESNYGEFKTGGSGAFSWDNGMKLGNGLGGFNWDNKTFVLHFSGIPDKLSFSYNCTNVVGVATQPGWWVKESEDGVNWPEEKLWNETSDSQSERQAPTQQLKPKTRYLMFCYSGNFAGVFKNINVTELKYFYVAPNKTATEHVTSVNMGTYDGVGDFPVKRTIYLRHANAGSDLQITIGDTKNFRLEYNISTGTDQMGDAPITIIYEPDDFGIHNTNLTIHDGQNADIVIPVNAAAQPGATYTFIGTDGDAKKLENWKVGETTPISLPNAYHPVAVQQPMVVSSEMAFYELDVRSDQYSEAKVTIAPTGGLTIVGPNGVRVASADKLIIQSSIEQEKEGQGYLRISPKYTGNMPQATVQLATRSTLDNGANKDATWQYVGIPTATQDFEVDYITWLYEWSEPNGWVNLKNVAQPVTLNAWKGYAVTQYGQPTYEWKGQLLREDKTIELTCTTTGSGMNGDNLFANSYSSPIDVKRFTEDDFEGTLDKTFYIFNSGSWNQWNDNKGEMVKSGTMSSTNPGQYIGIPVFSAAYLEDNLTMIAPMQGVYVYTETGDAKIKLNYTKHVWQASSTKGEMNLPLRAPQDNGNIDALVSEEMRMRDSIARVDREKCEALSHRIRISAISENSGADFLYVLEEENFTHGYDNGYEAPKIMADAEGVLNIYTNEAEAGLMSVAATNDVNEMFIGFNAGEDVNYELYITSVIGDDLELMDMQTGDRFALRDSASYEFAATPNSEDPYRFRIFKSETKPVVPTGWTGLGDKAQIWYNKQTLYISDAAANSTAAIYTADGVTLKQVTFNHNTIISTADMPEGVYTVRVEDSVLKFFVKH